MNDYKLWAFGRHCCTKLIILAYVIYLIPIFIHYFVESIKIYKSIPLGVTPRTEFSYLDQILGLVFVS